MPYPARAELRRSNYRLLGLVGQGQFGQVFCALHRPTGQLVALKNLEHDRFPTHKFLRELRFLLSLRHPNIVTCRALEHTSTGRYLVMDYCEGGTLRGLITEESRLSLPHAIKLLEDLLAGLDHAHSRKIVHCDIKPENILVQLTSTGWLARISDFGIARLSQDKMQEGATGSPAYMAPERFYGQYSVASDLYSVGILLFELITGNRPFSGTPSELMLAHLNSPLQMPDSLPPVWQAVIAKALQKLPGRRFNSAAAMLAAVRQAQGELSTPAIPLFATVMAQPRCQFEPVSQQHLDLQVNNLAADQDQLWQAAATQMGGWVDSSQADQASTTLQPIYRGAVSEPVKQLAIRPQGCFVITKHSLALVGALVGKSEQAGDLHEISRWDQARSSTIDPQGDWVAWLSEPDGQRTRQLTFQKLSKAGQVRNQSLGPSLGPSLGSSLSQPPLTTIEIVVRGGNLIEMLALDRRHLGLFWERKQSNSQDNSTAIELLTRRGNRLGELELPLRLRQLSLTPKPYRLLATDDCSGTVLLLDLKPYRIKRLWVEISPQFLVATTWGFILAEASGTVVFLDLNGLPIGRLECPAQITALTFWQNKLWIATWNADQGALYRFDLHSLGLDLVF